MRIPAICAGATAARSVFWIIFPFTMSVIFAIISVMSMRTVELPQEIFSRYGTVRRARRCFLYTSKGVRLTDLYQEGGRAILGWGGGAFTVFKNVIERGITGSYLTDFSSPNGKGRSRLDRAVSGLFGDERTALVFPSKSSALEAALSVSPQSTSVYRPWNPQDVDWKSVDCAVLVPPLPWTDSVYILAVRSAAFGQERGRFDSEVFLSAPLCAAVTRALYDLIAELPRREEKHWFVYDTVLRRYWTRTGPYLFPNIDETSMLPSLLLGLLLLALVSVVNVLAIRRKIMRIWWRKDV